MYSALADILKLLPSEVVVQLTDDEGLGEVNADRVSEAIAQADAEIDGWVGGRYAVPLAPPGGIPDLVKKLSVDIAVYNLFSRTALDMPEVRQKRYDQSVSFLKAVAKGDASLGAAELPETRDDSGAETNKATDTNVFSRDTMEGF